MEEMQDTAGFAGVLISAAWPAVAAAPFIEGEPELVEAEEGRDTGRTAGERCCCAAGGFAAREGDCGTDRCEDDVGVDGGRGAGRRREGDFREKTPLPTPPEEDAVIECADCVTLDTDADVRSLSA